MFRHCTRQVRSRSKILAPVSDIWKFCIMTLSYAKITAYTPRLVALTLLFSQIFCFSLLLSARSCVFFFCSLFMWESTRGVVSSTPQDRAVTTIQLPPFLLFLLLSSNCSIMLSPSYVFFFLPSFSFLFFCSGSSSSSIVYISIGNNLNSRGMQQQWWHRHHTASNGMLKQQQCQSRQPRHLQVLHYVTL